MTAPAFAAAVRGRGTTTVLDVEVTAGASDGRFPAGYNPWRSRIGVRVQAPAEGGRANREVCAVVAAFFHARPAAVRIVRGETSAQKTLEVNGVAREEALTRLSAGLA